MSCGTARLNSTGSACRSRSRGAARSALACVAKSAVPPGPVAAHLDTLGAQVKRIKETGRLEVVPIGHWNARFAEGARCTIFTELGSYTGTILPLKASGHTFDFEIDTQPAGWDFLEVRVDARSSTQEEARKLGIEIGDIVAIDPQPEFLDNGFICSRHLDDKAGVAVMFAALKALSAAKEKLPVDVYFLFTIEEEVGDRRLQYSHRGRRLADRRRQRHDGAGAEQRGVRRHDLDGRPRRTVRLSSYAAARRALHRE